MATIMLLANSSAGLYDFRNELVLALLEKYDVIICVPDEIKTNELLKEGCQVINTPINRRGMNPVQDLKLLKQYIALLKKHKPDMVLTYTIKPNVYGGMACQLTKTPYMTSITGLGSTFEKDGMVRKLVTMLYKMGLRRSRCVFFQNVKNREIMEQFGIHGLKSKLVPGSGVNLEKHPYEAYGKQTGDLQRQGYTETNLDATKSKEAVEILMVSRVMKEKGIEEYIACAQKYHSDQVKFGIIGYCEEDYEAQIQELNDKGIIHFYGFQKEVHEFLKKASCIMVPSYHEGMSNVILEAAATGRPVLASRIHGCKEAVDDGVTGLLFEARDKDSTIEAVGKFLSLTFEEKAQMGKAARKKMEREFDRQIVVNSYMEEINACV